MSTTGKEYRLAIRIAGIIDKSFNASLSSTKSSLATYKATIDAMDKDFTKLDKGFNKIMTAGKNCFKVIATSTAVATAALTAATAASVAVGSSFESAFAGVKKTVDATDEQYAKLRSNILEMTRSIPSDADEIAGVMEIAGQLGIATDSLTDFTKTMINLGVSTNMAADEAATNLARFANVTNMADYDANGISNYERLGSVITDLGNKFATTESEIVEMGTRLASTGHLVGLSQAQIMALATAMSSVGIKAESGGSTMAKLLKKMQLAVETNSAALDQYASVSDMTGEQFKKTFQKDAVEALSAFIGGLNDTERNGKSAIAILDDMGLSEVRLSNTILALAGSGDLMTRAIQTANTAWDENTALATEAGKRYETVESQARIMVNAFKELGITAYDDLREPLVGGIGAITDKLHQFNDYLGSADGVKKWVGNITTELPTLERKAKSTWNAVKPLFTGIKDIGEWFIDNPNVIVGGLATLGSGAAIYKTASSITHLLSAISKFSQLAGPTKSILGWGSAISILIGVVAACEAKLSEMADDNLDEHFGDIALSMEQLQNVAAQIVNAKDFDKLKDTLDEFSKIDDFSATMKDALSEINKLNWKVNIGLELTADDKESYKQAIDEYVKAAQDYAQQTQYAVSMSLSLGLDSSDPVQSNIIDKVNGFYSNAYSEMTGLGEELSKAVNDAFSDDVLDPDEVANIADIQQKIAKLKAEIATDQFNAKISATALKYSGGDLTPDSFKNLQAELGENVEELTDAKMQEYAANLAALQNTYKNGGMTASDFNIGKQNLDSNYLKELADAVANSSAFQINTIMGQYAGDIGTAVKSQIKSDDLSWLKDQLSYTKEQLAQMDFDPVSRNFSDMAQNMINDSDFQVVRKAMSKLLDAAQPTIEQLENVKSKYEAMGQDIPDSVAKGLENFDMLQGVVDGDMDSLYKAIGMSIAGTEYADVIQQLADQGRDIPQALLDGIKEGAAGTDDVASFLFGTIINGTEQGAAQAASSSIYSAANSAVPDAVHYAYTNANTLLGQQFAKGFTASSTVKVSLTPTYSLLQGNVNNLNIPKSSSSSILTGVRAQVGSLPGLKSLGIKANANGGIWDHPILTTFAEKGKEAAIPIDGSQNAINLWRQTGHLLGMDKEINASADNSKTNINNVTELIKNVANNVSRAVSTSNASNISYADTSSSNINQVIMDSEALNNAYNSISSVNSVNMEKTVNPINQIIPPVVSQVYNYLNELSLQAAQAGQVDDADNRKSDKATLADNLTQLKSMGVKANANGGIWDHPILTTFAERGTEAAIPIDGSQNAINLWEQTGHLLGMDSRLDNVSLSDAGSSGSPVIEYSPVLKFYGSAPSKDDLTSALDISQEKFEKLMAQYVKDHGRVSFG